MKQFSLSATANPLGNSIDLTWTNTSAGKFPQYRIVRRSGTFPTSPDDGDVVCDGNTLLTTLDSHFSSDLDSLTFSSELYQTLHEHTIPCSTDMTVSTQDPTQCWKIYNGSYSYMLKKTASGIDVYAAQGSVRDMQLQSETVYYYALYPYIGIPRKYYIDRSNHASAMATGNYNHAGQMYDLLPAIYHRYDTTYSHHVEVKDKQKGLLRRILDIAGCQLDQTFSIARSMKNIHNVNFVDGNLLPLLAQWIGWKTDFRDEFDTQRNNINKAPYLYKTIGLIPNAEAAVKQISGWECRIKEFVHNVFLTNNPEQLNLWETQQDTTGAWSVPSSPLSLDFAYEGRPAIVTDNSGTVWAFYHTYQDRQYKTEINKKTISVIAYKKLVNGTWSESSLLTNTTGYDKNPTACVIDNTIWVFWTSIDPVLNTSVINAAIFNGVQWSFPQLNAIDGPFGASSASRKLPMTLVEISGIIWLFWFEYTDNLWLIKYNYYSGSAWHSGPPVKFPHGFNYMEDATIIYHHPTNRIYVFWAQKDEITADYAILYIFKNSTNPGLMDWDTTKRQLPKPSGARYHDREPGVIIYNDKIQMFWSSNKEDGWSIYTSILDPSTDTWDVVQSVIRGPYSQRNPQPYMNIGNRACVYRSNQCLSYESSVYTATETKDFRYAGSTSLDANNNAKCELQEQFDDFINYTYDTGKTDNNWYNRNTIGVYLTDGTGDQNLINRNQGIIKQLLREILPIQVRPVFVIETVYDEKVYTYDFPLDQTQTKITEVGDDKITAPAHDNYNGGSDALSDTMTNWHTMHSTDTVHDTFIDNTSVDFSITPSSAISTEYRTWHIGFHEE